MSRKKLVRAMQRFFNLQVHVDTSRKAIVYKNKKELTLFIVRYPIILLIWLGFIILTPFYIVFAGIKSFSESAREIVVEDYIPAIISVPVVIWGMVFYKKVNREVESEQRN